MRTEQTLQTKIKRECIRQGFTVYKFASPACRGVPDLLVLLPGGRTVFVEVKSPTGRGRLTALQEHEHAKIRRTGHHVYTCDSLESFRDAIAAGTGR